MKKDLGARTRSSSACGPRRTQAARERLLLSSGAALPGVVATAPVLLLESRAGTQSALIGAGASRGIVAGCPIAVPEGLVGRVVSVGATVSRAQLLLDASAAAGARIVRTQELGVVRGDGRGGLRLNNIPTTSRARAGDVVESAGIDGIYPRGVLIGRIDGVARGSDLFLEIRVTPAAPFSRLTDVLVLAPSPAARGSPGREERGVRSREARPGRPSPRGGDGPAVLRRRLASPRIRVPVDCFLIATAVVARGGNTSRAVLRAGRSGSSRTRSRRSSSE